MKVYRNKLDKFGYPQKKTPNNKVIIKYEKKIFFFSSLKRKFNLCFKVPSFTIIDQYYHDNILTAFYYNKIREINFFGFSIFVNLKLIIRFLYYFLIKKKIILTKNEIVLFGPYPNNHFHIFFEFLLRVTYLKNINFQGVIWLPSDLKIYLKSSLFKKTYKKLKIKFFDTSKNILFLNCSYLTHVNTRWYYKKKKKFFSKQFRDLIIDFRNDVSRNNLYVKNNSHKNIIVSRSTASGRMLINENKLYQKLKKYNFVLVDFSKYSFKKQFEIAKNCKIMIGYHGAGLSNTVFMNKNSTLIEIYNKYYNHKAFECLSEILQINYKSFKCVKNYKNLDGICDVDQIESYVKSRL